jgi:hypothetical protein
MQLPAPQRLAPGRSCGTWLRGLFPPYLWHAHVAKQLLVTSGIVEAGLLVRGEGWLAGIRFVVS